MAATEVAMGQNVGSGNPLNMNLKTLLKTRLLIQANSGGGKSWTVRRLLERTHGRVQQIVIDPEGEFSSLREKYDYVLVGKGGEVAANPRSASLLARRLMELGVSAIIDLYELPPQERIQFVKFFLDALIDSPKELWHPVLVVLDEAHNYCPEKSEAASSGAVTGMMTRGRKRGICGVLATQRLSKLDKDAAAECNNLMVGRTSLDLDRKRAVETLGITRELNDEVLRRLPKLSPGDFYCVGPAISSEVVLGQIGRVETTAPEMGKAPARPPPPKKRVLAILSQLSDLPQEAEEEARTVEDLRREVRRLKALEVRLKAAEERAKALPAAPKASPGPPRPPARLLKRWEREVERAKTRLLAFQTRAQRALVGAEKAQDALKKAGEGFTRALEGLQKRVEAVVAPPGMGHGFYLPFDLKHAPPAGAWTTKPVLTFRDPPPEGRTRKLVLEDKNKTPKVREGEEQPILLPAHIRILEALGTLEALGFQVAERVQVAIWARTSPKSSAYTNNLGFLRGQGLIDYPAPNRVALKEDGRALTKGRVLRPTKEEFYGNLESLVGPTKWRILKAIREAEGRPLAREELAAAAGVSPLSSAYTNNLGFLRSMRLIDYSGPGQVVATDVLLGGGGP